MSEALSRPLPEIFHGLGGGGSIEPAKLVVTADDTHHFDVDDVGCRMIGIRRQALPHALCERPIGHDLVQA